MHAQRQHVEDGVGAGRDGHRDGEHVVDQQRAAGNHAGVPTKKFRRDHVAAATRGKVLDDLAVRNRQDHDRYRGGEREEHGQEGVVALLAEGSEALVGTVS